MIEHENEVKKIYPDAVCVPVYDVFSGSWMTVKIKGIEYVSERYGYIAWEKTYNELVLQGLIKTN
jgi:hypothetical protein